MNEEIHVEFYVVFLTLVIVSYLLGRKLGGKNKNFQQLDQKNEGNDLPPFHVREEKIRRSTSTVKTVLLHMAQAIHKVDSAADTSSEKLKQAKSGVSSLNPAVEVKEAQKVLLSEIDRVITSNVELKSELDSAQHTLDEQKKEIETLRHAIHIDHLTQVANRSFFDETLKHSLEHFNRYKDPFSLIMIDIDHFKKINDSLGHPVGDQILTRVAQKIYSALRANDIVARYGGEEFSVILVKSELPGACSVAEELRKIIEVSDFKAKNDVKIPVTVSLGVTTVKEGDTEKSIVERADKALYEAKHEGRNKYSSIS